MAETIALFGTSADPPTMGHQAVMTWLAGRYDRVLVWAVDNPFKTNQTPLADRQAMLKVLLDSIDPPLSNVSWRPDISHRRSIESVIQVQKLWPDAQVVLVIGSDILSSLLNWYRIGDLMERVQFLMIQRPDYALDSQKIEQVRDRGGLIQVADFQGPQVASSDFRLHRSPEGIPAAVLAYVAEQGLYQPQETHV